VSRRVVEVMKIAQVRRTSENYNACLSASLRNMIINEILLKRLVLSFAE